MCTEHGCQSLETRAKRVSAFERARAFPARASSSVAWWMISVMISGGKMRGLPRGAGPGCWATGARRVEDIPTSERAKAGWIESGLTGSGIESVVGRSVLVVVAPVKRLRPSCQVSHFTWRTRAFRPSPWLAPAQSGLVPHATLFLSVVGGPERECSGRHRMGGRLAKLLRTGRRHRA